MANNLNYALSKFISKRTIYSPGARGLLKSKVHGQMNKGPVSSHLLHLRRRQGCRGGTARGLPKNLVLGFVHAAALPVNKLSRGRVLLGSKFQHSYPHLVDLKTETEFSDWHCSNKDRTGIETGLPLDSRAQTPGSFQELRRVVAVPQWH